MWPFVDQQFTEGLAKRKTGRGEPDRSPRCPASRTGFGGKTEVPKDTARGSLNALSDAVAWKLPDHRVQHPMPFSSRSNRNRNRAGHTGIERGLGRLMT